MANVNTLSAYRDKNGRNVTGGMGFPSKRKAEKPLPHRGRWHGIAVTEGVFGAGSLCSWPLPQSASPTAPSEMGRIGLRADFGGILELVFHLICRRCRHLPLGGEGEKNSLIEGVGGKYIFICRSLLRF